MSLGGTPKTSSTLHFERPVYLVCERCGQGLRFLLDYRGERLCRRCVDKVRRGEQE